MSFTAGKQVLAVGVEQDRGKERDSQRSPGLEVAKTVMQEL